MELTVVAGIISALSAGTYLGVQKGRERECINNLKNIYQAVTMFEMDNGTLPAAKFFPSSASDNRGIHFILAQYGARGVMFCPSLPAQLNNYGTNYIWNDEFSGKSMGSVPSGTWLMTEMTAVNKKIPSPHMAGFSVLYAGGNAQIAPRVVFPDVAVKEPPSAETEIKKPEEAPTPPLQLLAGLNVVAKRDVMAGEELNISVYMSDASGSTLMLKPGTLKITHEPAGHAEMPEEIEVKGDSGVNFTAVFHKAGTTAVKVRDEKGNEGVLEINVTPGGFNRFGFESFPVLWEAGLPQKVRIILLDKWENRVEYNGEAVVSISSTDRPPEKITVVNGVWEGELILNSVSEGNLIYAAARNMAGVSPPFTVKHSVPSVIDIISAGEAAAGASYEITAVVRDACGNVCVDYTGEVEIGLPEGAVSEEKKMNFLPENAGMKKNNLTFFKSGSMKIQVFNGEIKGEKEIYVNPGDLSVFSIREIGVQEAGKPFDILVRAVDKWGNQVKGYYLRDDAGTVEYVNRDFTAGVWMETVVITKAGEHTIFLEDPSGRQGRSNAFMVKPSVPVKIEITGLPVSISRGREYAGNIAVKDKFGNELSGYKGDFLLEHPEDIKASVSSVEGNAAQIKVTAGKNGHYKLTVQDKNNRDLSAERYFFVTEAD